MEKLRDERLQRFGTDYTGGDAAPCGAAAAATSRPRRRRCAFCVMPIAALVIRIGPDRTGGPTYKRPNQRVYRFGSSKRPLVQLNHLKPVEPTGFL